MTGRDGHHDNKQEELQLGQSDAVLCRAVFLGLCFDAPCWTIIPVKEARLSVCEPVSFFFWTKGRGTQIFSSTFVCFLSETILFTLLQTSVSQNPAGSDWLYPL